jgi:hypothetical protein
MAIDRKTGYYPGNGEEMEGECEAICISPSKGAEELGVALALVLKLVDVAVDVQRVLVVLG